MHLNVEKKNVGAHTMVEVRGRLNSGGIKKKRARAIYSSFWVINFFPRPTVISLRVCPFCRLLEWIAMACGDSVYPQQRWFDEVKAVTHRLNVCRATLALVPSSDSAAPIEPDGSAPVLYALLIIEST